MAEESEITGASIRYKDDKGEWKIVNPHDPLYAASLFIAEEYYDGTKWVKMVEEAVQE